MNMILTSECEECIFGIMDESNKARVHGSTLSHNGVNISAVIDMLGHADETTTLKHYIYNTATGNETGEMVLNALSEDKVTKSD